RVLLGEYFRDQFWCLVRKARLRGFEVSVHESCAVTDVQVHDDGVRLWVRNRPLTTLFDRVVLATGHVWPQDDVAQRSYFASPWSGLLDASILPGAVGILGTSLSAIDAAIAVAAQHGRFTDNGEAMSYVPLAESARLRITLMSRS